MYEAERSGSPQFVLVVVHVVDVPEGDGFAPLAMTFALPINEPQLSLPNELYVLRFPAFGSALLLPFTA